MPSGIGEALRAARRAQGASLADVAAETRVRESYLAALEEEDFAALGGDVYVKGFLRSYARFLRLDPDPLLATYRREYERPEEASSLAQAPVQPMVRERQPGLGLVAGGALIVLVLLVVIGLRGDEPEQIGLPPAPAPASESSTAPLLPGAEPALPAPDVTTAADGLEVTVTMSEGRSWIRVIVDGVKELEGEQPQGTTLTYEADEEVVLRIGDPAAVSVAVNGEDQGRLGAPGEPVNLTYTAEGTA
jgi:cytoskeleton protein RodZ